MSVHNSLKTSLRRDVRLSQYTTMQVGGRANYYAEPTCLEELLEVLDFARGENLSTCILGKGSNMIFSDEGFSGLVISLLHFQKNLLNFDEEKMEVTAGAGVYLYGFALACRAHGFGGAEFLASIPGTIGGAVYMNAGFSRHPGQKNEMGDLVEKVRVLTPEGDVKTLYHKDLQFLYRQTNIGKSIVIDATLKLWRRFSDEIDKEIKACFDYRNEKQDLKHPSSGSIFKNPVPPLPPAAKLIEELGLKGERVGGIQVSEQHSNYFINVGNAKSSDVVELIAKIQEKVFHAKEIWLEPEVRIIAKS